MFNSLTFCLQRSGEGISFIFSSAKQPICKVGMGFLTFFRYVVSIVLVFDDLSSSRKSSQVLSVCCLKSSLPIVCSLDLRFDLLSFCRRLHLLIREMSLNLLKRSLPLLNYVCMFMLYCPRGPLF